MVESQISPQPLPLPSFPSDSTLPSPSLASPFPSSSSSSSIPGKEYSGFSLAKLGFHGNSEAQRESVSSSPREMVHRATRESVSQSPRESVKTPRDSVGSARAKSRSSREPDNHPGSGKGSPRSDVSGPISVQDSGTAHLPFQESFYSNFSTRQDCILFVRQILIVIIE